MNLCKQATSRRSFVAGITALGLAAAASAEKAHAAEPESWDEECDVLIIGSGYAGLSAAFEAADAGASVKVIEKLDIPGGNSMISGGDIAVCGSKPQADAGVEDSVEKYIQDMLTAGDNLNDVEKCRIIAEKSNETWEWTCDVLGAEWESPRLDASVDCTNSAGATAEALCAAIECGALPVHLDWIQCGPWCSPDEEGYGVGPDLIDRVAAYSLDLNPQTGRRVCSELTDRKRYCDAILAVGEPLIQVVNEPNLPSYVQEPLAKALDKGVTLRFDSIDEVCEHFGLPADAVKGQLDEYNSYVTAKKDEQFGKAIPDDALPIEEGPFYITRR